VSNIKDITYIFAFCFYLEHIRYSYMIKFSLDRLNCPLLSFAIFQETENSSQLF